jgi:multidrug efflux pump subunit AcrA (membrane-fusion protein)
MKPINTNKSLRRTQIFGFGSIFVMLGIFGAWTALADINGAVIAPATIIAESYSKKVQHREGGNISRILVKDGELVQAGQDLVLLDPTETKAELGIVDGQLQELLVKKSRLEAQRDGLSDLTLPSSVASRENDQRSKAFAHID